MPRRKALLVPKGRIILGDMPFTCDMEAIKRAIRACSATRRLPRPQKNALRFDLGAAAVFAKIGVAPWLSGKRVKPAAWNLDIFVRDAADAWRRAGLRPTVRYDAKGKSEFLGFCEDAVRRLRIPSGGVSLFHAAVRAREIIIDPPR